MDNVFDDLLYYLHTTPKRTVKTIYVASFRLPTFAPGEDHGRDYINLGEFTTREEANQAELDAMKKNADGTVFIRQGRKVHTYTQAGVYLGYYTVTAQEEI